MTAKSCSCHERRDATHESALVDGSSVSSPISEHLLDRRKTDEAGAMTDDTDRHVIDEDLAPVLLAAGFSRQGRQRLWLRTGSHRVHHAVSLSGDDQGRDRRIECGVWVPELTALLSQERSDELDDMGMCQIRLEPHQLQRGSLTVGAVRADLAQLGRLQTLDDVRAFITSDEPRAWPTSPAICELYVAGIAVLTGAADALARAEAAAAHLAGGSWSAQANRVYGAVATGE
jgi:hypothetical protein